MICTICGFENPDEVKFCGNCGNSLKNNDDLYNKAVSQYLNNDPACIQLFYKCAYDGNENAYAALGEIYDFGEITEENVEKAVSNYEEAIKLGSKAALVKLGSLYFSGRAGETKRKKAFPLFLKYFNAYPDDGLVNFELFRCFRDGVGTEIDDNKAVQHIEKAIAAEPDNHEFYLQYGFFLEERNNVECIQKYMQAQKLGSYDALYYLGIIYSMGEIVPEEFEKAEEYLRKAIDAAEKNEENEEDAEMISLAKAQIEFIRARKKEILRDSRTVEKHNLVDQEDSILTEALEAADNGLTIKSIQLFNRIPDNVVANFFITYYSVIETSCDESDSAINRINSSISGVVGYITSSSIPFSKKINALRVISEHLASFSRRVFTVNKNKYYDLLSIRSVNSRLGPIAFANNTMTQRLERTAKLLYRFGDEIEQTYKHGDAYKASKIVWENGNLAMEYCSQHGSFFEKQERKSLLKKYNRKIL